MVLTVLMTSVNILKILEVQKLFMIHRKIREKMIVGNDALCVMADLGQLNENNVHYLSMCK